MEESLVVCEVIASPVVIARQFQSQNLLDDMFHNLNLLFGDLELKTLVSDI